MFEIFNFLNNTQTFKTGRANGFIKTYQFLTLFQVSYLPGKLSTPLIENNP